MAVVLESAKSLLFYNESPFCRTVKYKIKETLLIQELQSSLNVNVSSEKLLLFQLQLFRTDSPKY